MVELIYADNLDAPIHRPHERIQALGQDVHADIIFCERLNHTNIIIIILQSYYFSISTTAMH